jgi:hypothetical protein
VGAGSLSERQLLPDEWAKGAIFQTGDETGANLRFFGFSDAPQGKSEDRPRRAI